jgi:hypothetical protein
MLIVGKILRVCIYSGRYCYVLDLKVIENCSPFHYRGGECGHDRSWKGDGLATRGFLDELGKKNEKGVLHSDSQSAIFLAKNPAYHSRTKHIQLRYDFIRSLLESEQLLLEKIRGTENLADMLTKGVTI